MRKQTNRRSADAAAPRQGPFWDVLAGRAPMPAAAALLGWQLVAVDPDAGTIEVSFDATDGFCNPVGNIQGGLLAAMLDDTLGPALVATLAPDQFAPTLDLHVQFVRAANPGPVIGRGRVVSKVRSVAFVAGELVDERGELLATATATAAIRAQRK
ncbi:MAG: hotdog fold thioesterase [Acidimicrobiia bacterium]|nr:hotdog fold thioesterase [Acidimicrobiia bacterium]